MAGRLTLIACPEAAETEGFLSFLMGKLPRFQGGERLVTSSDLECMAVVERVAGELGTDTALVDYRWDRMHTSGEKPNWPSGKVKIQCVSNWFPAETAEEFRQRVCDVLSDPPLSSLKLILCSRAFLNTVSELNNLDSGLIVLDFSINGEVLEVKSQRLWTEFEAFHRQRMKEIVKTQVKPDISRSSIGPYLMGLKEAVRIVVGEIVSQQADPSFIPVLRKVEESVIAEAKKAFERLDAHYQSHMSSIELSMKEMESAQGGFQASVQSSLVRLREEQTQALAGLEHISALISNKSPPGQSNFSQKLAEMEQENDRLKRLLARTQQTACVDSGETPPLPQAVKSPEIETESIQTFRVPKANSEKQGKAPTMRTGFLLGDKPKDPSTPPVVATAPPAQPEKVKEAASSLRPSPLPKLVATTELKPGTGLKPLGDVKGGNKFGGNKFMTLPKTSVASAGAQLSAPSSKPGLLDRVPISATSCNSIDQRKKEMERTFGEKLSEEASQKLEAILKTKEGWELSNEVLIDRILMAG